ncbi:MAG: 2-oxoacid:acceptor oxidoreductase family protein [Candidatus Marinimicrobia bacterium]|nr:2-oxoacid:acceptor oxidoreductase family protein [Candidatus Neomarinimicrobiota bacterium]
MAKNILTRSTTFYDEYYRKPGADKKNTTYCPGCGHGILHKLVAEALEDFGVRDRSIFISPVGCSVFGYYYFHTGNIQAAHGRAPAVGTGVKRANPDSIVISYQGDGDLAAIGGLEILHAANRGEGMTVFFVNNAIYGMTGGQMAPTSLEGQVTTTTPRGRSIENEGYPVKMSEIIATLDAPVYVERVMLADTKSIMHARKAVRKALKIQIEGNGFAFVEALAACTSNLRKQGPEAMNWVKEVQQKIFPIGVKKDISDDFEAMRREHKKVKFEELFDLLDVHELNIDKEKVQKYSDKEVRQHFKIAGFGGQGVLSLGTVLSEMGMRHDYEVSWLPSYGPEMRGGTANCSVKISSRKIGTPLVDNPTLLVAMNRPSLDKFEDAVVPEGIIIYDSSLIDRKPERDDIEAIALPATKIADELGNTKVANMVIVGAINEKLELLSQEVIMESIGDVLKKAKFVDINRKAIGKGAEFIRNMG